MVGGNLNIKTIVKDMRMDNRNKMHNWFMSMVVSERVDVSLLDNTRPIGDIKNFPNENYLMSAINEFFKLLFIALFDSWRSLPYVVKYIGSVWVLKNSQWILHGELFYNCILICHWCCCSQSNKRLTLEYKSNGIQLPIIWPKIISPIDKKKNPDTIVARETANIFISAMCYEHDIDCTKICSMCILRILFPVLLRKKKLAMCIACVDHSETHTKNI